MRSAQIAAMASLLLILWISPIVSGAGGLPTYSVPLIVAEDDPVYFAEVMVGTPPQKIKMLFDIANPNVAIPTAPFCAMNPHCYSSNFTYQMANSTTSEVVPCNSDCSACTQLDDQFQSACAITLFYNGLSGYQSSSVRAIEITDTVSLEIPVTMTFAGVYEESQDLQRLELNGIFGMGAPEATRSGLDSWFGTLVSQGSVKNQFSFCLGNNGGVLVLGGTDVSLYNGLLKYSPLVSRTAYLLEATEFDMDGEPLEVSDSLINPVYLDNTVRDTILSYDAYQKLVQLIDQRYCNRNEVPVGLCGEKTLFNGYCFPSIVSSFESYPGFSFVLQNDVNLTITAQNYLYRRDSYYCSSIIAGGTQHTGIILGTNVLRRYYTSIDLDAMTVGFSLSVGCSEATYVLEYISGDQQKGTAGQLVSQPLVAQVRGFGDNSPVQGINVTWEINRGDGKIEQAMSTSDAEGYVSTNFRVGFTIGANVVTCSLKNAVGSPVVYYLTGVKGAWFYVFNTFSLLLLSFMLAAVLYHQKAFHKQALNDNMKEQLTALGFSKNTEQSSLLDWADMHDHPVRNRSRSDASENSMYAPTIHSDEEEMNSVYGSSPPRK